MVNPRCQNFKVGDTVLVREWEDMEGEFGVDSSGNIPTDIDGDDSNYHMDFVTDMRHFCGREYTIKRIDEWGWYRLETDYEDDFYCFSDAMFEREGEEIECNNDILDFLNAL